MADLNTILSNTEDMKTKWITYVAHPYARAYATALNSFKETKGAQDKLNSQRQDMCVMALTLCSGGVLTTVFAQTAWKAVAANKALSVICNNNMNTAFNVAHFVSTNKVANFVVGSAWDQAAKYFDDKTKSLFEQTSPNFPSVQKWVTETAALTCLEDFVSECYLKYRDAARSVVGNSKISESERGTALNLLAGSSFAKAPAMSTVDETRVAKEIELMFYLNIIMDLDFTQTMTGAVAGGYGGSVTMGPRNPISAMPGTQDYPKPYNNSNVSSVGTGTINSMQIGYSDLGMAFYNKVNELHTSLYGRALLNSAQWGEIWNATMNKEAFTAAATALGVLESAGLSRFKQSLSLQ